MPRGSVLAGKSPLRLSDPAGEPFVMYASTHAKGLHSAVFFACQYAGFIPKVSQYAIQVQTVLAPVDSGLGVALVPSVMRRHISDKIVCRPLPDVPPGASIGLALAYMAETESPAAARFRNLAASRMFAAANDFEILPGKLPSKSETPE